MRYFRVRYQVHSSWLIAALAAGFLLGGAMCLVGDAVVFSQVGWCVVAIGGVVVAFWRRSRAMVVLIVGAGALLGLWRGSLERVELAKYRYFIGQAVSIRGVVAEDVERGGGSQSQLKLVDVIIEGVNLPGQVWVSTSSSLVIKRSDRVLVSGKLREGFGNFPASLSFARVVKAERPEGVDIARDVRDRFADAVRGVVAEPMASLGIGFLTGQRSSLPPDLDEQLKIAGLTHIVVASGYNLTILVRFARRLFARVSKYASTMLAAVMVVCFMFVTGFSPSMSRAGSVAGLSLATWYYGRAMHPLVLLPFVAALTVAINPLFLWGDMGWYLSFAAFAGVMIVAPLVHHYFWGTKKAGIVRQILVDTSCAQLVTMPIIAFSFGTVSSYALLANVLILPFIPLTMALTFAAGVSSMVVPWIGYFIAWPTEWLLRAMIMVTEIVASLPGAQGEVAVGAELLVVCYLLLCGLGMVLWRRTKHDFRRDSSIE